MLSLPFKEEFLTVVRDLFMRALLNCHQTPQVPGMSTVECSKGSISANKLQLRSEWQKSTKRPSAILVLQRKYMKM